MQWIGLLDCNNFFVSCERLFRPDLKSKPVLVLSSNDGCVVARSKEIKDKGIPMGVPYFKIKDIIKDIEATTFSSHFALYRDISRRVFEVMRKELDTVEQYSIDEAFFVISGEKELVRRKAVTIKDRVEREVGIPVSIGLAQSKTQAKYASTWAKRTDGVCLLLPEIWQEKLPTVLLRDLWGVGLRSAETFKSNGLTTVEDYLKLERRQVKQLFGVVGERLWLELRGFSAVDVEKRAVLQQSILHSRSFKGTSNDLAVLKDAVAFHIREAAEDLRAMGQKSRCLQVTLGTSRHGDYLLQGGSAVTQFDQPTNDTFVFLKAAANLVDNIYKPGVPYKKAGILLSCFQPESVSQLSMFEQKEEEKTSGVVAMIDLINKKTGRNSVLLGSRLQGEKWQSSQESKSPAYTTAWSEIAIVRT